VNSYSLMPDAVYAPGRVDQVLQAAKSLGITGAPLPEPSVLLPLYRRLEARTLHHTLSFPLGLSFLSYAFALTPQGSKPPF
jgi:hypothetical protein